MTVQGISENGSYFNESVTLDKKYDFNNDGKVDINDYQYAKLVLTDEDPNNDVDVDLSELDTIFKSVLSGTTVNNTEDADTDELNQQAEELLADVENIEDPANATSLLDLQEIGRKLTSRIKNYSDMAASLANKMSTLKTELDALDEERKIKEEEYATKAEEVEELSGELADNIDSTLDYSEKITNEKSKRCDELVDEAIKEYTEGKHPNMTLQALIMQKLATNNNSAQLANLQSMIDKNEGVGESINSLCSDIDALVADIKDVTERYNNKNTEYNRTVNNRNSILEASQKASDNYQTGYAKRTEMRNEIINKYKATGGSLSDDNGQIQALSDFLDNGELDNMTFADAWYILTNTFNDIEYMKFNSDYSVDIPHGHSSFQKSVFNKLASKLNSFGAKTGTVNSNTTNTSDTTTTNTSTTNTTSTGFEDINITATEETTGTTGTTRTDPISFSNNGVNYDFVVDRDNDGVFDGASEFLGAQNGWAEMKQYDTNGDGHISGDELNNLKLVGTDQATGQFNYTTAAEAGITDINLSSYKKNGKTQENNNVLAGTFSLTTDDGKTVQGQQTYDTEQNLNNKYGILFGTSMENADMYSENPFMSEFKETLDTEATTADAKADITSSTTDANSTVKTGERKDERTASAGLAQGNREKARLDEKAEREETKKQEKAELAKQEEAKKANKKA